MKLCLGLFALLSLADAVTAQSEGRNRQPNPAISLAAGHGSAVQKAVGPREDKIQADADKSADATVIAAEQGLQAPAEFETLASTTGVLAGLARQKPEDEEDDGQDAASKEDDSDEAEEDEDGEEDSKAKESKAKKVTKKKEEKEAEKDEDEADTEDEEEEVEEKDKEEKKEKKAKTEKKKENKKEHKAVNKDKKEKKEQKQSKDESEAKLPFDSLEPFGRDTRAQALTETAIDESNAMVDQLERAEVAEEKRSVFRALTRLRGVALSSFDGIAKSQTSNIKEYAVKNQWRKKHPVKHLAEEESDVSAWAFPAEADF